MTSITAARTSLYTVATSYAARAQGSGTGSDTSRQDQKATTVSLSEAALAAMAGKDLETVVSETRTALTGLLKAAGVTSPYANGKLTVDLSSLDRRALYAVFANEDGTFTAEERTAARAELSQRFDQTLSGPSAVARVTGDYQTLYQAALDFFDSAGTEEKASESWIAERKAIVAALKQALANPGAAPAATADDPVANYLERADRGEAGTGLRPLTDVAKDVRIALDKQYADAQAAGKRLTFSTLRFGQPADFSAFDSRSLSAMALDDGTTFKAEEIFAAKTELRQRNGAALLAGYKAANSSGDPTAFSRNLISQFASMSAEERQATGWSNNFYDSIVSSYKASNSLSEMMSSSGAATGRGNLMSILNYI